MENRNAPTETEVAAWLAEGRLTLPPLQFQLTKNRPSYTTGPLEWDFELKAEWGKQTATFAVEYKRLSTPQVFQELLLRCRTERLPRGRQPLILVPYLKPSQLEELELSGISGVDWCGNGVILSDKMRVFRTGSENRFLIASPIKNIYRKTTSMIPRTFLARARFASVKDVLGEVNRRNLALQALHQEPVSLGTVSKALQQMEADLIVDRGDAIRLIQMDRLLESLRQNYVAIKPSTTIRLKVDCPTRELPEFIAGKLANHILVATGASSTRRYATFERGEMLAFYCASLTDSVERLGGREEKRFPNVELIETRDPLAFFDARLDAGIYWAAPVQTYLELAQGDKRDREAAEQVHALLRREAQ